MKNIIAVVLLGIASLVSAQTPATPAPPAAPEMETVTPKTPYDSTKAKLAIQTMKTDALQFQGLDLSKQIVDLVAKFDQTKTAIDNDFKAQTQALSSWQDEVRKANSWDSSYTWSAETDTWSRPKATKAPETKK